MKRIAYIHGLNSSPGSFSYIVPKLTAHEPHLISYKSYQRLSESLVEVYEALPKGQPLTLVGHSLGGVIATLIAAEHPELVEKLVVMSSPFKGSFAAHALRWLPGGFPVFRDVVPSGQHILKCQELNLDIPTLSIITTGGSMPTVPEPNDSVITIASQNGLCFGKKVEINATHFEVLLNPETVRIIDDFIFGENDA